MAKHRTRAAKGGTNTVTIHPDPVVNLSEQLFALWNADDASQLEYYSSNETGLKDPGREIQQQFGDWRQAVATIISYTSATTPAGALVQLALALDELDSLLSVDVCDAEERQVRQLRGVDEHRIERLIRSAMRAVQKSLGTEFESVRGIVQLYASDNEGDWLDNVPKWAQEGPSRASARGGLSRGCSN
jgi:hypothetical protein